MIGSGVVADLTGPAAPIFAFGFTGVMALVGVGIVILLRRHASRTQSDRERQPGVIPALDLLEFVCLRERQPRLILALGLLEFVCLVVVVIVEPAVPSWVLAIAISGLVWACVAEWREWKRRRR